MASGRQVLDRCLMSRPMIGPMEGRGGMPLPRPVACSQRGGEASQEGMHTSQFLAEQGRSYLCSLSDDMLFSVLQHGGPACLARLRATSSGISLRCGAQEPRCAVAQPARTRHAAVGFACTRNRMTQPPWLQAVPPLPVHCVCGPRLGDGGVRRRWLFAR
jgi:hypothetical protein